MGVVINGAISSQSQGRMTGQLDVKNAYATQSVAMVSSKKTTTKTKRALNYNYREISGQLLRAKKVQGASNVVSRAKSRLASLQRCATNGQYDTKEVANAIAHARRMVRCAQMKVNNLREEEREQGKYRKQSSSEIQKRKNEVKRRAAGKERQVEQKLKMELLQDVQKEKSRRQEIIRKRKAHRSQERGKILEADMKYIKGLTEDKSNTSGDQTFDSGVFVQLSASAISLAEAEMAQRLQLELDMELAVELSADAISVEGFSVDTGSVVSTAPAPVAQVIDVAL